MTGIEFIGPSGGNVSPEFEALRASVGAPPPWFDTSALSSHLSQAMWFPARFFSSQQHLNAQSGRPFSLWAYYADDPDVIAYCVADEDRHLATIGTQFVWRLVRICDRLAEALSRRPRIGVARAEQPKLSHDPEFAALLAGDIAVSRDEAVAIAARWPEPGREGQQLELGPYALFHDLVRLIWVHEWAHALTGHVRFASRDLQLMALPEMSAERSQLQSASADRPPAHEVFQAIELHADEFAVRYCAQQILWGYDPIGRMAGPRVDLVDRLLIFNTAFCVFAVLWWIAERRYTPGESFYAKRTFEDAPEGAPARTFETFTTTHPPAALRYLRFRDFERELAAQAGAQYGGSLSALVDAVSFGFLNEALTDLDEYFGTFLAVTPGLAKTPTMKTLIDYESHLLRLNKYLEPHLIELGYVPTRDPMAADEAAEAGVADG